VVCLLAAGVSLIGPSRHVAGQETREGDLEGVSRNTYTGNEDAWTIEWDDAVWEAVDARSNQQDNDSLRLEARDGGESFVRFSVVRRYAGDAQACQRAIAGSGFEGDDETSEFVYVEEGGDALRAVGSYTYTLTKEGGAAGDWFLYLECRQFVPGDANLVVSLQMPLAEYEESGPLHEELLAGLTLPPGADEPLPPIEAKVPSAGGGSMPMLGGNPARSGEQVGPGPESAPAELWRTKVPEAAAALRGLSAPKGHTNAPITVTP
jgi:hypothetical protein